MPLIRLQKIMAASGLCSRRQAEELIAAGHVKVDGRVVRELGTKADPEISQISIKGQSLSAPKTFEYVLFHKPQKCVVTTHDPEGRPTIYDFLPSRFHHLKPVGRLDYHSRGLLILTNDGRLTQKVTHPRHHFAKVYEVKVTPKPNDKQLNKMRKGIIIDDRRTEPAQISVLRPTDTSVWLKVILREGRNRQIRRLCEVVGLTVKTLVRVSIGSLTLSGIPYGKFKVLSGMKLAKFLHEVL